MKKKYKYIFIIWIAFIFLLWALSIFWFQFFSEPEEISLQEQANSELDEYNFQQLEEGLPTGMSQEWFDSWWIQESDEMESQYWN